MSHHKDDEYTPEQRRAIDHGVAQSEREYKQGRSFGPFATHAEFIAALHKEVGTLDAKTIKTRRDEAGLFPSLHSQLQEAVREIKSHHKQ